MDLTDAWRHLGIEPTGDVVAVRTAYLQRLHIVHPDHSSAPDANDSTFALTTAYQVVVATIGEGAAAPPASTPIVPLVDARIVPIAMVEGDTIAVALPGGETYALLVEAAHRLGEITHIEPSSGMLQVIVEFVEAPVSQLLMTLQGRATGVTEIFCSIESLENRPAPPIDAVTQLLLDQLVDVGGHVQA